MCGYIHFFSSHSNQFFCSSEILLIYLVFLVCFFSSFTEKCTHKNENRFDCSHVYERTKYFNFFYLSKKRIHLLGYIYVHYPVYFFTCGNGWSWHIGTLDSFSSRYCGIKFISIRFSPSILWHIVR